MILMVSVYINLSNDIDGVCVYTNLSDDIGSVCAYELEQVY
jgi:hypothetical protein